ncbi:MAG: PAS domain-containing protein [Bacteroidales bacterium]|nr:PAS domain-containing protein [Bacteroidales bacterium]
MRILLLTILLLLTAFAHNCKGQSAYVYSNICSDAEQQITMSLYSIDPKHKQLWINTLIEAEKAVCKEKDIERATGSLARIYQLYNIVDDDNGRNRCIQKITHLSETSRNLDTYVSAQIMQAYNLIRQNRTDSAITIYQKAIKKLEKQKAFKQLAKAHCCLGHTYNYAHNRVLGIRNMLEAVSIVKNDYTEDSLLTGEVYLNASLIYLNDGDYHKAEEYVSAALSIFMKGKKSNNILYLSYLNTALIVSANIKLATGEYDAAISLYNEGINGFSSAGLKYSAFNTYQYFSDGYNGLGITYQKKQMYDEAIKNMLIGFDIRTKLGLKQKIADSYITIADYYNEIKQTDSAYIYFEKGFNAAYKVRDVKLLHQASQGLANYYHKKRDYEKAYKYLEIANNYYQDVLDMKQSKEVAREEMDYLLEQERDYAKKINAEQDATIKRDKIIIYLAVTFCFISALMLALIIVLFYKRQKKNRLIRIQRDQLELRSKQLQTQQEEISQKNQELRATTEMLEANNKELRLLSAVASMTSNSIFITDAKGNFIWFNDAFTHDTNIHIEELHTHPALQPSAMPLETKKVFEKVIATKQPYNYSSEIIHWKGMSPTWVQTAVTPVLDENGEISMIVWVNTDISEIRAINQQLQLRNNELTMLSAVASSTANSIYITTKEGKMIWFNDAFSRETHIPIEELHTHPALKFEAMTPETREVYNKVIATKKIQRYTAEMKHLEGEPFWVQSYVTPILDNDGEIKMIVWVSTNITELHHAYEKIENQNKEINASISYARRIQDAVQPMKIFSDEILGDHFVINMPRNIVSGDFHWVGYKNGLSVFTVADCTGHGVPGAFISMLGQVMLNQTLSKLEDITSAKILDILRNGIIHQLHQRDKEDASSDSMDASMFVYDRQNCIIDFAGAYSYGYLLRFGTPDAETEAVCKESGSKIIFNQQKDAYLIRLKPNRMTIGIDRRDMIPFKNIKFKVNHGDIAYATTDGYPDQFGGEKQKRFYVANFERILLKYCHLTMIEQRQALEKTFLEWKGDYEQTDDVHVLGIVL